VKFPNTFSLVNFKSANIDRIAAGQTADQMKSDLDPMKDQYELVSFIEHKGTSCRSGHYTATVKEQPTKWVNCNDKKISPLTDGLTEEHTEGAYLLFY
jgi:ubiquitin C-terminal hydrolase